MMLEIMMLWVEQLQRLSNVKNLLLFGVTLLIICGETMAGINPVNIEGLSRFKQRINYQQVTAAIRDDEKVLMDWQKTLQRIEVSGKGVWINDKNTTYSKNDGIGVMSGYLIHKSDNIMFEIYVFSENDNKTVADQAANLASVTSMMDLNYQYRQDLKADFYIYGTHWNENDGYDTVICTFRNVILRLSASSEKVDVKPFAEYLLNKMSESVLPTAKLPKISPKVSVSSDVIKVGDNMWMEIGVINGTDEVLYIVDIDLESLSDGLDYLRRDKGKYFFIVESVGDYKLDYTVLDSRSLLTTSGMYQIHIDQ